MITILTPCAEHNIQVTSLKVRVTLLKRSNVKASILLCQLYNVLADYSKVLKLLDPNDCLKKLKIILYDICISRIFSNDSDKTNITEIFHKRVIVR
jgi:hypothetical protein